jgi:hypothetical protein
MSDASMDSLYPAHSPDGLYHIEWSMFEARMSHWICSPKVVHAATGQVIFDFIGSNWDASFRWLDAGRFYVYLREYPAGGGLDVWVDPPNGVFRIGAENGEPELLSEFRRLVLGDSGNDGTGSEPPPTCEWTTIEVDMPGGRREKLAVLKGFEEQVRKTYAELAAVADQKRQAGPQIRTCPHLHPIERAIEEAIAASVGRFEARGFSLRGPDPRVWGSPGSTWRCYSCGGGEAPCYLDTLSLRSKLPQTTPVTYDEDTDPGRQGPTLARFCCEECQCAILGVPASAIDDSPSTVAPEGWRPWRLIVS